MRLLTAIDSIFRDRQALYEQALSGPGLFSRMVLLFVAASACYGAGMGSFRLFHPEYFYSDFEISTASQQRVQGKVLGVNVETHTVYTQRMDPIPGVQSIRFNVTQPSEPVPVVSMGSEKDFGAIVLPPCTQLEEPASWLIPLHVAWKTPLLFMLTLLVCALALYVFNLALDARLHFMPVMNLMSLALAATGTMLFVALPIALLFSFVTESYHFMKIFHVVVFGIAGAFGVKVLREGLSKMAAERTNSIRPLLSAWLLLYCLVGGQIAWTLKPFLGTPYLPATPPFRIESGNIYVSTFRSLGQVSK